MLLGLLFAVVIAGFMSYLALEHNPQGRFCDLTESGAKNYEAWGTPCSIVWGALFSEVFVPWLLMSFPLISAVAYFFCKTKTNKHPN